MDQYWLEVAIDTTPDCLDDVAAYLTGCGIVGLSLENEADLNEFMAENKAYWDEVDDDLKAAWKGVSRVKFYVTEDEDGKARLAEVEGGLGGLPSAGGQGRWHLGGLHHLPAGRGLVGELEAVLSALPRG